MRRLFRTITRMNFEELPALMVVIFAIGLNFVDILLDMDLIGSEEALTTILLALGFLIYSTANRRQMMDVFEKRSNYLIDRDFDGHLESLAQEANNPFELEEIQDIQRRYRDFRAKHAEYELGEATIYGMVKAAQAAQKSIYGIAHFPPDAWTKEINPYLRENIRAAQNGLDVNRVFVITPDVIYDKKNGELKTYLNDMLEIMAYQHSKGIKVWYGYIDDIKRSPFYVRKAFVPCAYFDGQYFGWNHRTATSLRFPEKIRITWNPKEIANHCPFPHILESDALYRFSNGSEEEVQTHRERIRAMLQ